MNKKMAAVIRAPLEAGDNIPNIAKTENSHHPNKQSIEL